MAQKCNFKCSVWLPAWIMEQVLNEDLSYPSQKIHIFFFLLPFQRHGKSGAQWNFSPVILNKELTFNCTPPWSFWYYGKKLCGTEEDSILWKILKHPRGIVGVKSFYRSQNPSCVLFLWNINDVESHRIMQSAALFLLNVTQEAKGQDKPC